MTDDTPTLKIVARRRGLIVMLVICLVFAAMGVLVLALAPSKTLNLIVGIAAIGFFGVGGGISFVTQWRRGVLVRADGDGLRLGDGSRLRWEDVDRIGGTATLLGVRLRRYDAFLATAPRSAGHTTATLKESRVRSGGWDLTWPARLLREPATELADRIRRRRPGA